MTDDELDQLMRQLPRTLCAGCGEQILTCQKQCPVCYGCPRCGRGGPKGQVKPTQFPMPGGVTGIVPFACERCGGCGNCCTCKGGPKL
jgi:hypothetical protein